jgi:rRNA-processing protein FCF1
VKDVIEYLFARYRNRELLIDTNILLLYFVGSVNRARISEFKRTQQFVPEDYDTLLKIIDYFSKIVTTPNILTEVNSLANQLGEPERSQCFAIFGQDTSRLDEFYTESRVIAQNAKFIKFGLTDCGILNLVRDRYLVLTDDLRLANYLQKEGIDTINFNNIRVYGWR